MKIIIPCAGRSSRYPDSRPKYLLTMPDGNLMFMNAARQYYGKHPITFVIIKEHCEKYDAYNTIKNVYGDSVDIVILDSFTNGPAETIYKVVSNWKEDTPFLSHDCDSFYDHAVTDDNFITYVDLKNYPTLTNVAAKSFIALENNIVNKIVEKRVVSNNICVGTYSFNSSFRYIDCYEKISKSSDEIFLSHIIKFDIDHNKSIYKGIEVENYIDCGTYQDYINHINKSITIFSDIDGVVFENQSRYFSNNYDIDPVLIPNAIDFLLQKQNNGATLVFTTSRPEEYKEKTSAILHRIGFNNFVLICGLPHAPRMLINDVSTTNPLPSAVAINVPRDSNDFWKAIK